jgi:hypothetical protein
MKKVNNKTKWDVVIDWIDNDRFLSLSKRQQEELKEFRKRNNYIKKLQESIDEREKELQKLKTEINERVEKIRVHKLKGIPLYEKLVELKKENEVVVYYSEGKHKKQLKGNWKKKGGTKEYPQTNLKYKSRYTSNPKSINLKPTREETINTIKELCPKWYKENGEKVLKSDYYIPSEREFVKRKMILLFEPLIKELLQRNSSKKNSTLDYKIRFDEIKNLMKEKKL